MKYFILSISLLLINYAFAVKTKETKVKAQGVTQYQDYICKTKVLPMSMRYSVLDNSVLIGIKFESDLKDFQIFNATGIDGLTIHNFNKVAPKDVKKQSTTSLEIEYTKDAGLSYLVIEVTAKVNGETRGQMLTIPVGELSQAQIDEREKNIKLLDQPTTDKQQALKAKNRKKIHRFDLKNAQ